MKVEGRRLSTDVGTCDMSDRTHTSQLGEFIAHSAELRLPADVVATVKLLALDAIGCGLLASSLPWTLRLLETIRHVESPGPALVWGHTDRFSPANTAMINGASVQGFELDDVGPGSHYGSVTMTVALALAGAHQISGADVVRSVVVGIEVASRIADGIGRKPHVEIGFHGPGLFGTFAAAATAASLLRLDEAASTHALSTAAQFAGGIMAMHHGGMAKRLLAGKAAHSGTLAAQLSQHGYTNVDNVFECGYGSFSQAFTGGQGPVDLSLLTAGLGERYRVRELKFKRFACRGPIHPALDAAGTLRAEHGFSAADIDHIDVALPLGSFRAVGWPYQPASVATAQLNLQYSLAVLLIEGRVFIEQFSEDRLRRADILDLAHRIRPRHDPALDDPALGPKPRDTLVRITLNDRQILERRSGAGLVPATDPGVADTLHDKFAALSTGVLDSAERHTVMDMCDRLDELADANDLVAHLVGGEARKAAP